MPGFGGSGIVDGRGTSDNYCGNCFDNGCRSLGWNPEFFDATVEGAGNKAAGPSLDSPESRYPSLTYDVLGQLAVTILFPNTSFVDAFFGGAGELNHNDCFSLLRPNDDIWPFRGAVNDGGENDWCGIEVNKEHPVGRPVQQATPVLLCPVGTL